MDKEILSNANVNNLDISDIVADDESDIIEDNLDIPCDENYDRNQITVSINKNYVKPYFFNHSAIKKSPTSDTGESNYKNINENLTRSPTHQGNDVGEPTEQDLNQNEIKTNKSKISTQRNSIKIKKIKASKNWSIILNTIFLINRMRNVQVKRVKTNDLEEHYEKWFLNQEIDKSVTIKSNFTFQCFKDGKCSPVIQNNLPKQYKWKNDEETNQLEFIAKQIKFFNYLSSGGEEYFEEIMEFVNNDPNKFMFNSSQKNKYFVNQKNIEFVTPLYVATINGHLKIVKFLCENGADYLMKNGKYGEGESVLDASIRWKMVNIMNFYLESLTWPKIYLENAILVAEEMNDTPAKKALKYYLKKQASHCHC